MLFKVLRANGTAGPGGVFSYSLPTKDAPGEWTPSITPIIPCKAGYHLTNRPSMWAHQGARLLTAEYRGMIMASVRGKVVCESVRLLEEITPRWKLLPIYPEACAVLAISWREENPSEQWPYWVNMCEADLSRANFSGTNLDGANLSRATFFGADLYSASLRNANLNGASLQGAQLNFADLHGTDLRNADLRWSNCFKANLTKTNLNRAILDMAELSEADLCKADVSEMASVRNGRRPSWLPRTYDVGIDGLLVRNEFAAEDHACGVLDLDNEALTALAP